MNALMRLIRLPNLLMLFITVLIYGTQVLYPTIARYGLAPKLTFKDFLSLLFVFACVAAAGYIHNDITDIKTDTNNEKRQIIGKKIAKGAAWLMYIFLIIAPLPLVYYLSTEVGDLRFIGYYCVVIILLFGYNTVFQRIPLIGNITVAALCAVIILLPALAEHTAIAEVKSIDKAAAERLWMITTGFVLFAFVANLIREIIKDIEDMDGDLTDQYKTLPIVMGIPFTRVFILLLEVMLLISLGTWIFFLKMNLLANFILISFMIAPILWLIYKTYKAREKEEFTLLSGYLKFYFALGILALAFIH